jgi:ankyrin repeat protein
MKITLLLLSLFTLSTNCMEKEVATLFTAIDSNNLDQVASSISQGNYTINAINDTNDTPLQYAIKNNKSCEIINLLLQKNAHINNNASVGELPLHLAAKTTTSAVLINLLIQAKSEINALDKDGYTPLAHALPNNKYLVVNALIRANAELSPLGVAIKDAQEVATTKAPAPKQPSNNALVSQSNNLKRSYTTFSTTADLPSEKKSMLSSDSSSKEQPISKKRNIAHKDESIDALYLLHTMILHKKTELVRDLIEANWDINEDKNGYTPLHLAITHKHKEIIQLLIDAHANVDSKDPNGFSSLHFAITNSKDAEIVAMLIKAKANINAIDKDTFSALHHAVLKSNNKAIVTQLINAGVKLNAQLKNLPNSTALDAAIKQYQKTGEIFFAEVRDLLQAAQNNPIVPADALEDTDSDKMIIDAEIL